LSGVCEQNFLFRRKIGKIAGPPEKNGFLSVAWKEMALQKVDEVEKSRKPSASRKLVLIQGVMRFPNPSRL
jgi:hypothetical protein